MEHPTFGPPSLREMLDAGCDLEATGVWLEGLAEDLYVHLPVLPPGERMREAEQHAFVAEDLVLHGEESRFLPVWADGSRSPRGGTFAQYVMLEQWRAEIYEDHELAGRLAEALPTEVTAPYRAKADGCRRPHPLAIGLPETWWSCDNCGASFDEGQEEAVTVTSTETSNVGYDIHYCFGCIKMVAEAVNF